MSATMLSNLESIGEFIGSVKGIASGLSEDEYMENLIKQAHGKASNAFDIAAAATASATDELNHVYEYGTAGITGGQPKFADPTHPTARLWMHTLKGQGGNQDIGYTFRPATAANPKPTTASTGVPSKYLRKLSQRKYVFWNKAFVMETGMSVQNKSHQPHGMLFLPFNHEPSRATPPYPNGHVMWNTHTRGLPSRKVPGAGVKGNFTQLWMTWWAAEGSGIMEQDMLTSVNADARKAIEEAARKAAMEAVKPAQATNVPGAVSSAWSRVKRTFGKNRSVS